MKFFLIPLALAANMESAQIDMELLEDARLQHIENCDTCAYECTKEEVQEYEKMGYDSYECHADKYGDNPGFREYWEKKFGGK